LAFFGLAWPGFWPQAGAGTSLNWVTKPGTQAATNEEVPSVPLANSLSTPHRLIPIFLNPDDIGEFQEPQAATNEEVPSVQLANSLSTPRRLIPIFIDPHQQTLGLSATDFSRLQ
jgi:hypothetical protein